MSNSIIRVQKDGKFYNIPLLPSERKTLMDSIAEANTQIQALTERNEFLEDLVAELAVQVYSTPPNA